jgi:hypothetical protein
MSTVEGLDIASVRSGIGKGVEVDRSLLEVVGVADLHAERTTTRVKSAGINVAASV